MTEHKPFKVIVVGAGAAGYVAAAAIRKNCPHVDVTIVHDPATPHIGVGETLAWNAAPFFKRVLGLTDERAWIADSNSAYKLGVYHEGWSGKNTNGPDKGVFNYYWWNPSASVINNSLSSVFNKGYRGEFDNTRLANYSLWDVWLHLYNKGLRTAEQRSGDLSELHWYAQYDTMPWDESGYPMHNSNTGTHSYNINSEYFKDTVHKLVGIPNGVKVLPIKVREVVVSEIGIDKIILDDGQEMTADLYIDSTGFNRMLVKKLPSFKWEKCDDYFNNAALVGSAKYETQGCPSDNFIKFHSMKHGWVFSLPFPNRTGEGYQFNRNIYDNEDAIVKDYEQKFPNKKDVIMRKLTWNPGFYDKIISQNCLALGISHGFADVYDANNFSTNLAYIGKMIEYMVADKDATFAWRDDLNSIVNGIVDDVKIRIQSSFHLSPRNDSLYWQAMKGAAIENDTLRKFQKTIFDPKRKGPVSKDYIRFFGQGILATHAIHYGIDLPIPNLPIDKKTEQLAVAFFDFYSEHNRIKAKNGIPRTTFYKNFYNK
jgi:Tryptophan halogenase